MKPSRLGALAEMAFLSLVSNFLMWTVFIQWNFCLQQTHVRYNVNLTWFSYLRPNRPVYIDQLVYSNLHCVCRMWRAPIFVCVWLSWSNYEWANNTTINLLDLLSHTMTVEGKKPLETDPPAVIIHMCILIIYDVSPEIKVLFLVHVQFEIVCITQSCLSKGIQTPVTL